MCGKGVGGSMGVWGKMWEEVWENALKCRGGEGRCGEVCWGVGGSKGRGVGEDKGVWGKFGERCGEVCWGVGEVRKDEGRDVAV